MCDLKVKLDDAKEAIKYMIRKLEEDMMEIRRSRGTCDYPPWDKHPWQCFDETEDVTSEPDDSAA